MTLETAGGFAGTEWSLSHRFSHIASPGDSEPSMAYGDYWTPPHCMALDGAFCDRMLALSAARRPDKAITGNGAYWDIGADLALADREAIVSRIEAANAAWWGMDLGMWVFAVKRYAPGVGMPGHQDLHPRGGARRKLAASIPLVDGDAYDGGELVWEVFAHDVEVPCEQRGTLAIFPAYTRHRVEPVTAGTRWALLAWAGRPEAAMTTPRARSWVSY